MNKKKKNIDVIHDIIEKPIDLEKQTPIEAENVSLIIKEWLNLEHIKTKTRLTRRSARAITILQGMADDYKIIVIDNHLIEYRINQLSIDGQTSKELTDILKARLPEFEQSNLDKLSKFLDQEGKNYE